MKTAILIGSHPTSPWIENCVRTMPRNHPVIVYASGGFECGAIKWCLENTLLDEFLFFHDSVEIKDPRFIDEMFTTHAGRSVAICQCPDRYGSFLGKYRRSILEQIGVPETLTKRSAIKAERWWTKLYCEVDPPIVLFPELMDNDRREMKFSAMRMVLENEHIKKFKTFFNRTE